MQKRAEMGVGTLIIFIAMLLVAAVAAGVLIQTVGSLQEKALSTGSQAEGQIATNAVTIEISAVDGSDGTLELFTQIMKLAPGSESIKLSGGILTFNTYTDTATLQYRGVGGTYDNDGVAGYNTVGAQELGLLTATPTTVIEDLDSDNATDNVTLNRTHFLFTLSGGAAINVSAGGPLNDTTTTVSITAQALAVGGTTYGYLTASGSPDVDGTIRFPESATFTVTPENGAGTGYYTVEYLQQGSNFVDGNLQRGDVIKVYYEAPGVISEDEELRLNFIPKIGTSTLSQFVTPEVISTERVYLYP